MIKWDLIFWYCKVSLKIWNLGEKERVIARGRYYLFGRRPDLRRSCQKIQRCNELCTQFAFKNTRTGQILNNSWKCIRFTVFQMWFFLAGHQNFFLVYTSIFPFIRRFFRLYVHFLVYMRSFSFIEEYVRLWNSCLIYKFLFSLGKQEILF